MLFLNAVITIVGLLQTLLFLSVYWSFTMIYKSGDWLS